MTKTNKESNIKNQAYSREIIKQHLAKLQWLTNERARRIHDYPQILLEAQAKDEVASDPIVDNECEVKAAHEDGLFELDSEISRVTRAIEESKEAFRNDFGKEWND